MKKLVHLGNAFSGVILSRVALFIVSVLFFVSCSKPNDPTPIVPPDTRTVPTAPAGVSATPTDKGAKTEISPSASDGGSSLLGYTVTSNPVGGVDSNAGSAVLVHKMGNLKNGTAYTFSAQGINIIGSSVASGASNSITPMDADTRFLTGSRVGTDTIVWRIMFRQDSTSLTSGTYKQVTVGSSDSLRTVIFYPNFKYWLKFDGTNPDAGGIDTLTFGKNSDWAFLNAEHTRFQLSLSAGDIVFGNKKFSYTFELRNKSTGQLVGKRRDTYYMQ